jgi:hypothetical protein
VLEGEFCSIGAASATFVDVLVAATLGLEGELGSLEVASATFVVVLAAATSSDETTASIIIIKKL